MEPIQTIKLLYASFFVCLGDMFLACGQWCCNEARLILGVEEE